MVEYITNKCETLGFISSTLGKKRGGKGRKLGDWRDVWLSDYEHILLLAV